MGFGGGTMKVYINIYNQMWLSWFKWVSKSGAGGLTIFPFIFYYNAREDVGARLRRHEQYHWHHQLRWLVLPWYVVYWLIFLFTGYHNHPWEQLARGAE